MYRILIVEDEEKIAVIMQEMLQKFGYEAVRATQFRDLKNEYMKAQPHLVLLDINLPFYDGYYWCRQIRTVSNVPILFVSARSGEMDQVMAIENGGDDYLCKPFSLEVVLAKVKGALRRAYGEYAAVSSATREIIEYGDLQLHIAKQQLIYGSKTVDLSKNESLLVQCLIENGGYIVGREQLLEALWDDLTFVDDNTLTVNVTRVRKKLEEIGLAHSIETVRGQGYRFEISQQGEDQELARS
ncbi:winged helix-turn-helix domain-containing protein [Paenibacillus sp. KN14-4R]|uniref:winged helix-turn-helix domain-containing protein n=1 Tax=Paenibacillus sp. KN14-4R TaxID=3445773 RepID=UPI003FA06CF7